MLEEVSSRWKGSLIHPNREAVLACICFSADGQRLIAGDYPGGLIQLWEVGTGRQLTQIETGYGYRGTDNYIFLSPDWKTVYVSRGTRKAIKIEKEGKSLYRWEFEGDIRAWNLDTGELQNTFRQTPMRGIRWMTMSPDGSTFLVFEELPGESEGRPQMVCSFVDAKTGQFRQLPGEERLWVGGTFSSDSRTVPVAEVDEDFYAAAIRLHHVATRRMIRSLPIGKSSYVDGAAFSKSGKIIATSEYVVPDREKWKERSARLKFWDADTGTELASFSMNEKEADIVALVFSPDGHTVAALLS